MELFPTQYSTLSAAALKDRLEERYGLGLTGCRYLMRGVSDTYVLEGNSGKYIFKIYRAVHRSQDEIKGEIELLNLLKAGGAKVAAPIADAGGGYIQEFRAAEGIRQGVLFPFAKGRSSNDLTDRQLLVTGREMAFNHSITSSIELSWPRKGYDITTTLTRPIQTLAPAFDGMEAEYVFLQDTAALIAKKMASMDTAGFGYGYCHYDYFPKNFFFDEDDHITVFDFDFAGKGLLANDLASFHVHLFFHEFNKRITPEEAGRQFSLLIAGYREQRFLGEEEITLIPWLGFMLLTFYLGFQHEHFDDFSNAYFNPAHVNRFSAVMKAYAEKNGLV